MMLEIKGGFVPLLILPKCTLLNNNQKVRINNPFKSKTKMSKSRKHHFNHHKDRDFNINNNFHIPLDKALRQSITV